MVPFEAEELPVVDAGLPSILPLVAEGFPIGLERVPIVTVELPFGSALRGEESLR